MPVIVTLPPDACQQKCSPRLNRRLFMFSGDLFPSVAFRAGHDDAQPAGKPGLTGYPKHALAHRFIVALPLICPALWEWTRENVNGRCKATAGSREKLP